MGTSQPQQQGAAGIPGDGLWCISLREVKTCEEARPGKPSEDQHRSQALHGVVMQEHPFSVCGAVFKFFLNITQLVKCLFQQNITCPLKCLFSSEQLPETARDTTELLKRAEMSTSHSLRFSQ